MGSLFVCDMCGQRGRVYATDLYSKRYDLCEECLLKVQLIIENLGVANKVNKTIASVAE